MWTTPLNCVLYLLIISTIHRKDVIAIATFCQKVWSDHAIKSIQIDRLVFSWRTFFASNPNRQYPATDRLASIHVDSHTWNSKVEWSVLLKYLFVVFAFVPEICSIWSKFVWMWLSSVTLRSIACQMYLPCNSNESTRLPNGSTVSISPYVIAAKKKIERRAVEETSYLNLFAFHKCTIVNAS